MGAQHLAKGGLHKVSRRVVSHGGLPCLLAYLSGYGVRQLKGALFGLADVQVNTLDVLCGGFNGEYSAAAVCKLSAVACLSAAFAVEGGLIKNYNSLFAFATSAAFRRR